MAFLRSDVINRELVDKVLRKREVIVDKVTFFSDLRELVLQFYYYRNS
jgi:hypothetical protein